jgi:Na+-transporting NADH:ubiquinone oxidoreductase subunit C
MQHSTSYILLFAAAVCAVCSVFVSGAAVLLEERQLENVALDVQKQVLTVAGLLEPGESISRDEAASRFDANIVAEMVDLASGAVLEGVDPDSFDQRKAAKDPATSRAAPPNGAKVRRVPNQGRVYRVVRDGRLMSVIVPISGQGLWSTLYGYLALDADMRTISGITFYQHGETPGLGGEVDNPRWKALWKGRKAFDERGKPMINVKKGRAGPVDTDPYNVDGLSGATITSRGVGALVRFWIGDDGFGPYLKAQKMGGST